MTDNAPKEESKVEAIKKVSRHLRGEIAETLASDATHFEEAEKQLLKFHGTYQQDDRDLRHQLRKQGEEVAYQFMVRTAIPAGVLTADQYLAMDALADKYANGSLRVTTRQGIQFHGVLKRNLKQHIADINHSLLTTLSACGDVERNVMASPAPLQDAAYREVRRVAREIAVQLRPASNAYHEIWLDGEKHISTQEEEPFYGDHYLPRKFKTGIAHAADNSIDIYSYDAGLLAITEGERIVGYNVLVGGGMGMTHNKADTFAALAMELGFVGPEHAVEAVRTVAAIFRDHGNRADRRHARLKYLLAEWGIERFREEFRKRVAFQLHDWRPMPPPRYEDYLGMHPEGGGRFFYGVFVENGRIADHDGARMKTAFREVVTRHRPNLTLTASQNVLFTDLDESVIPEIEKTLSEHGVRLVGDLSSARRYSMACPALPTCGLAMAESERLMPSVVDRVEAELDTLGMRDVPLTLRMTGCPNGCARPYTADIAFVGRRPDVYHVYVGGGLGGDRMTDLYAADVGTEQIIPVLRPLLTAWSKHRRNGEGLGDFYQRHVSRESPRTTVTGKEEPTMGLIQLEVKL